MLEVNRSASTPVVLPEHITADEVTWRVPKAVEFYVDFETCSDLDDDFSQLPEKGGSARVFMVGCGHMEDGNWKFRCFTAESLRDEAEERIFFEWFSYMEEVRQRLGPSVEQPLVFHWSPAETSTMTSAYNAARERLGRNAWPHVNWYDFLGKVVKKEPVVVRGAFGFGLKAISKALHKNGLIDANWSDGPTDGLGAMVGSWWCYEQPRSCGSVLDVTLSEPHAGRKLMEKVIYYNEMDCKVMQECITYFRSPR